MKTLRFFSHSLDFSTFSLKKKEEEEEGGKEKRKKMERRPKRKGKVVPFIGVWVDLLCLWDAKNNDE